MINDLFHCNIKVISEIIGTFGQVKITNEDLLLKVIYHIGKTNFNLLCNYLVGKKLGHFML